MDLSTVVSGIAKELWCESVERVDVDCLSRVSVLNQRMLAGVEHGEL